MADINYNDIPNIETDWQGFSGQSVQKFIKSQLNSKMGFFYYDATSNRYLVFASEEKKNEYVADPTLTNLVLGTFDAPFNYSAEINLSSPSYNAIFLGSTGNYIDFTFDIKNKQGASTGENVTITYTFIRNAVRQTVTETRKFGDIVHFNIDKYLGEGTNVVMVSIVGQTTLAATSISVTYQVVNLTIKDELDISNVYDLRQGSVVMEVPFTVSGYGTKIVEWYIDGELLDYVKNEDEVVDVTISRIKYITLSNLQQGKHSLQVRAYTTINGEKFYTDTLYRDILIYTGADNKLIVGIATTIPAQYGIIGATDNVTLYGVIQYIPYVLRFATYSPLNTQGSQITIKLDGETKGVVASSNGIENEFTFMATVSGNKTLQLIADDVTYTIPVDVAPTTMDIEEITADLVMKFDAIGKNNLSLDREQWTDGTYTGTLEGFNFNNTSGWVNGRLEMNAGSSFVIDLAPLAGNPTNTGKTIEIEWSTKNVSNDDAVICDLRGDNGAGLLITATKVSLISASGVVVETEYKSDENVRVSFVINRAGGVSEQRLSYIYTNGIVSRSEAWSVTDNYTSNKEIRFTATTEAEVSLKSIMVYNTALTADNILNNFTLYRDTVAEMMAVYDRNAVYEEGTKVFSTEKMSGRLPVMVVTGDIPILENTSDKDTQIVVDIDYINMQNPDRSFRMTGAAMRPQGTSSMGYPKKNFRIYTTKLDGTMVYDADGNVIEDKLYAFKKGSQPVDCWCLKADYAESSGTHNTGIARLWNAALYNAQIDGEYKLRTEAQKAAIAAGYPYDVRTTIDGFPILLFYRQSENDDLIFIGKYNFNNDKSTESVFGFTGIPGFNNERMQCWEVLNNGNALALFTTTDGFDENWSEAFESRYPDTKTPNTADLKAFAEWMSNVSQEDFKAQKWEHFNIYMMAAYWIYLNRHAGADQFVKNAMFTSEDGQHFYYILYDNDTINGLINTGRLLVPPTATRQTKDASGEYYFAGHDSRLWNMLEADDEFMQIVSAVDNALYSAGISYLNTIKIFDEEQADKWVERVYNQDAQYKYIGPYIEKGINNLFMLQGKRDLHRKWWLAKRFAIYDAKYVSGTYKSQAIELKCINSTPAGQQFTVTAGYPIDYGYGINNVPRSFGIALEIGESHTFTTEEVVNLGDPIRIYGATNIAGLDLSAMASRLAVVTISNVYDEANGTKLTKLIIGNKDVTNLEVTDISGLKQAIALEYLDIQGMSRITSLDLTSHAYIKTVKAFGSGIDSVTFAKGSPVEVVELPSAVRVLQFEQLPYLTSENLKLEDNSVIVNISIKSCPKISNDFSFVYDWYTNKVAADANCSLVMDNVAWENVDNDEFLTFLGLKTNGGVLSLKGKVSLPSASMDTITIIREIFGDTVFYPTSDFFIEVPPQVFITSDKTSILEGENVQFGADLFPVQDGTFTYSIVSGREGVSIDASTGLLTSTESGLATSNVVVRVTFTPADGSSAMYDEMSVEIVQRVYPADAVISGPDNPNQQENVYTWATTTEGVNGDYTVEWSLSGDVTSIVEITESDLESCTLGLIEAPIDVTEGILTLTLKKVFDGSVVLTAEKALTAIMEGVIITSKTNAPIQAALYAAGLVANETYTLQAEAEAITAEQLQTGTSYSTSIFYSQRNSITHFEEFKYFTGVTTVPTYLFYYCSSMTVIELPETITAIKSNAFYRCSVLKSINIPNSVTSIEGFAFGYCQSLNNIYGGSGVTYVAYTAFSNIKTTCVISNSAKFGLFTHQFGNVLKLGSNSINSAKPHAFLLGNATSTTYTGAYFDDMTTSRTITLGWTGGIEDLTERLKIGYVTLNISSNKATAEFRVDYTDINSGEAASATVQGTGSHILPIKPSTTVTVTPITEYEGLVGKSATVSSASYSNSVTCNYNEKVDIYIQHIDGTAYTAEEWKAGGFAGNVFNGCAIISSKSCFVFESYDDINYSNNYAFGGTNIHIEGVSTDGRNDFDGEGNTEKIITQLSGVTSSGITGAPAAEAARNYIFPNGKNGYLPAAGQLDLCRVYRTEIESVFSTIGYSIRMFSNSGIIVSTLRPDDDYYYQTYNIYKNTIGFLLRTQGSSTNMLFPFTSYGKLVITSNKDDAEFSVSYTKIDGTSATKTIGVGRHYLDVKYNTQMTITPISEYSGAECAAKTFTYGYDTEEHEMNFLIPNGVYIQDIDGNLFTESEWTAGGYANENANGVAVISDETSFVIAKDNAATKIAWGSLEHLITDIVTTTEEAIAILDFDGEGNTEKIITQLAGVTDSNGITGAPAAEAARNFIFPNGKSGYLPAAGQWNLVKNNHEAVLSAFSAIGATFTSSYAYLSSTQQDINSVWGLSVYSNSSSLNMPDKNYKYGKARPVTSI